MKNHFQTLCDTLCRQATQAISRAQLPRLLERVNYLLLAQLIQQHYGFKLPEKSKEWLSGDGKELRGLRGPALLKKATNVVRFASPSSPTRRLW
jgi:hypothetical protein